jgi:hypothetical protein
MPSISVEAVGADWAEMAAAKKIDKNVTLVPPDART